MSEPNAALPPELAPSAGASPMNAEAPPGIGPAELAAATQAEAVMPLLVCSIEAVARSRLVTVAIDSLLVNVAALLSSSQISLVVVCNDAGAAAGVITETILVRQLGHGQADLFSTRAGDVMVHDFTVCRANDSLAEVLTMMHERGLTHVPVLDDQQRPIGVVNARDGLRALLARGNYEEALLRNYVMGVGYQ